MKKYTALFLLVVCCAAIMGLKIKTDSISREKIPGMSIIYIPSGKYLKYASFGYSSLMADMIYLWAIQYFSDTRVANRFEYMDHIFSIIAELDPRYLDPYELGAIIAVYDAQDADLAFRILDRGLEKNPDQWIFPFQAGHYAQMVLRDYGLAQDYYKQTMEIEGAPPIARRLFANSAFRISDYKTALQNWLEIYQTAEDERIKKIASNHLYQAKAAIDIQALEEAANSYMERFGRFPADLGQLVQRGLLDDIPQDLDDNDYKYDPQTGKVEAPTIPWKR